MVLQADERHCDRHDMNLNYYAGMASQFNKRPE